MPTRLFAAALAAVLLASPAHARSHHRGHHHKHRAAQTRGCPPVLGCGCNLASLLGYAGRKWRELWVARAWLREGSAAAPGCVECVVVLRRGNGGHVGIVKGYQGRNPVVYSYGNRRTGWHTATYSAGRVLAYRQL